MHADEPDVDEHLLRRMLAAQFPRWADLPVRRLVPGGTTNAIFRLGSALTARLPLTAGGAESLHREARWLPVLAAASPMRVPEVVAIGAPGHGYPWEWAVHRWIDGDPPVPGRVPDPDRVARDLAAFVTAVRGVEVTGAPRAHRDGTPADADAETRAAIEALRRTDEPFDARAAVAAWESALAVPGPSGPGSWLHSDLMPGNLLVRDGRPAAVLDFGTAGVGDDPAVDLVPAWNLLPAAARGTFRAAVDVDDDAWARGRGWALSMALIQLPYYRRTHPGIAANARHVLGQVLGG